MVTLVAKLEQDRAAGGEDKRKMKTRSGDVVVVSLAISGKIFKDPASLTLRFKTGGHTVNRPIGKVSGSTRSEQLKLGWLKVRDEKIAEQNGWSWVIY